MANTSTMILHHIHAYRGEEFLGYVTNVAARGTSVICYISEQPRKWATRRSEAVIRSAKTCTLVQVYDGRKFYPKGADDISYKAVEVPYR